MICISGKQTTSSTGLFVGQNRMCESTSAAHIYAINMERPKQIHATKSSNQNGSDIHVQASRQRSQRKNTEASKGSDKDLEDLEARERRRTLDDPPNQLRQKRCK